ncbi:hypothetical protein J4N02_01235 [Propioniciclava sp. MC1595]|jgi:DNA-directed RNA polymerase specialized sigma24 family protein|uniref:RNA polymerase sigma factor n=1 Tax=Propioniciclava sp. MC1595 TaxID=2760308 RepID=UPI0016626AA9|nr:hypothetical protein [Propioniciclava sp. MC1595]MBB1495156.1 hypothetical protein [Propioniciclava sp. MC1595]NLE18309.1 hypothetical protein [Propioniciclava sp.]QTE26290.1 hypothetical protein J4N02_01235 [Propioniciclava sp. MC1595]
MTCTGLSRTVTALNDEWSTLADEPAPLSWRAVPALPLGTLGDVLAGVRSAPDTVLLALLGLQAEGDALAGRVVVQAMLPKMILMAVRDDGADVDDYLAALWVRVATYPVARRPRRVAANLALDTLKSVKATRPRAVMALPGGPVPDPLADATTVLDAGVRLGAIDGLTRRTLEVVYVDGRSSSAAGAVLGMSAETVRWRCSKGVRALRAVAPELTDLLAG